MIAAQFGLLSKLVFTASNVEAVRPGTAFRLAPLGTRPCWLASPADSATAPNPIP